jgi:hypothetical protein
MAKPQGPQPPRALPPRTQIFESDEDGSRIRFLIYECRCGLQIEMDVEARPYGVRHAGCPRAERWSEVEGERIPWPQPMSEGEPLALDHGGGIG